MSLLKPGAIQIIQKVKKQNLTLMKSIEEFLSKHLLKATDFNFQNVVDSFILEMEKGLKGEESSLRMLNTYIEAENALLEDTQVLAIDAGGTNFRAAQISLGSQGKLHINKLMSAKMPGIDTEVSKEEFFQTFADYIRPLMEGCERIGFCFSYPTEIYPSKDGRLIQFCKEIKAPEVVGEIIGESLLAALHMPDKPVVLLNDTVSTLLAGKAANYGASFGSYIGYILGTGTNTCYIESNKEISKTEGLDPDSTQIINIESGNFGKAPVTDIDLAFDNTTTNPGNYTFEKMIAGGYFGGFCLMALKTAAMENVFSEATSAKILELDNLTTETVNLYIQGKEQDNPLKEIFVESDDQTKSKLIIEALIERSAKLIAANLAAVILKTGKGKSKGQPILITVEGSTFYKLEKLNRLVLQFLESYFVDEKQRYFKFDNVEQSSLIGAGLAALIDYSR